jgi:hypothetical protein
VALEQNCRRIALAVLLESIRRWWQRPRTWIVKIALQENIRWSMAVKTKQHVYLVVLGNIQPALLPMMKVCACRVRPELTRMWKQQPIYICV